MKISPRKYAQALAQTLEAAKDQKIIIANFLTLLQRKKQFRLLPKILHAFEQEWNRRRGIVKMSINYPAKFEASLAGFVQGLEQALQKKIHVIARPSSSLIGGFRIRTADMLIDASIEGRLAELSHKLTS